MHESPNKAIEAVVVALGGSKKVGPLLWPEKSVDDARRLLCDCLNDDRPAKLDFSQVLFILRLAKSKGIHIGMDYIADSVGYTHPTPVEPKDEAADLMRQVMEGQRLLAVQIDRLASLQPQLRATA